MLSLDPDGLGVEDGEGVKGRVRLDLLKRER